MILLCHAAYVCLSGRPAVQPTVINGPCSHLVLPLTLVGAWTLSGIINVSRSMIYSVNNRSLVVSIADKKLKTCDNHLNLNNDVPMHICKTRAQLLIHYFWASIIHSCRAMPIRIDELHSSKNVRVDFFRHNNRMPSSKLCDFWWVHTMHISDHFLCNTNWLFALTPSALRVWMW